MAECRESLLTDLVTNLPLLDDLLEEASLLEDTDT
jgi:hypothetical protein